VGVADSVLWADRERQQRLQREHAVISSRDEEIGDFAPQREAYDPEDDTFMDRVFSYIGGGRLASEPEKFEGGEKYATGDRIFLNGFKRIWNNGSNAAISMSKLARYGAFKAYNRLFPDTEAERRYAEWYAESPSAVNPLLFTTPERETGALGVVEGLSEGVMAYAITAAMLPLSIPAAALQATGKAGVLARFGSAAGIGMVQGSIADFTFFSPTEERLADWVETWDWLPDDIQHSDIIGYLKGDETDGQFEGRLKNVIEGGLLGMFVEPVLLSFKLMRLSNLARTADDAAALKRQAKKAQAEAQAGMEERGIRLDMDATDGPVLVISEDAVKDLKARSAEELVPEKPPEVPEAPAKAADDPLEGIHPEDRPAPFEAATGDPTGSPLGALRRVAMRFGDQVWSGRAGEQHAEMMMRLNKTKQWEPGAIDKALLEEGMEFGYTTPNGKFVTQDQALKYFKEADSQRLRELGVMAEQAPPPAAKGASEAALEQARADAARKTERGEVRLPMRSAQEATDMGTVLSDLLERNRRRLRGKSLEGVQMTDAQKLSIRTAVNRMLESGKLTDVRAVEGTRFNMPLLTNADEVRATLLAVTDEFAAQFDEVAKSGRDPLKLFKEKPTSKRAIKQIRRMAEAIVDRNDADSLIDYARELAGETRNMPEVLMALRMVLASQAEAVGKLSRLSAVDPDNPLFVRLLGEELDRTLNLGLSVGAITTDVARTLRALGEMVEARHPGGISVKAPGGGIRTGNAAIGEAKAALKQTERDLQPRKPKAAKEIDPFEDIYTKDIISRYIRDKRMTADEARALARTLDMCDGDFHNIVKTTEAWLDDMEPALAHIRKRATANAQESIQSPSIARRLLAFRAAMMVYSGKTAAVNAISTGINSFWLPTEEWVGGVLQSRFGTTTASREAGRLAARVGKETLLAQTKFWANWNDMYGASFKNAVKAFRENTGHLDASYTKYEGEWLQLRDTESFAGVFGKASGFSLRTLLSTDTFFKELTYRARVRALSMERHGDLLARGEVEQFGEEVLADLRASVDRDGGGRVPQALWHAREATFTTPLEHGQLSKEFDEIANREGVLGVMTSFVLPFRRTPANLWRWPVERFPGLGAVSRTMRADLKAGGTRRARAIGKQTMGTMLYGGAMMLAAQGRLNGFGPRDPKLREQWMKDHNWKPYSIELGGEWYQIRQLDPTMSALMLIADFQQSLGEFRSEEDAWQAASSLMAATTASLASRNFMRNGVEFLDAAFSGDQTALERFVTQGATSFLPAAAKQTDPGNKYVREAEGFIQEIASRTPFWATGLEPHRNHFGEPVIKSPGYLGRAINPFQRMDPDVGDEKLWELTQLGRALYTPSDTFGDHSLRDRSWDESDAGQSPWDRIWERMGPGFLNAEAQVKEFMDHPDWAKLGTGTARNPGGAKSRLINDVFDALFDVALAQTMEEPRYKRLQETWIGEKLYESIEPTLQENPFVWSLVPEERKQAMAELKGLQRTFEERKEQIIQSMRRAAN
jgi:hypothetical protein